MAIRFGEKRRKWLVSSGLLLLFFKKLKEKQNKKQKTTDMGKKIRLGFNNMIELKNNLPQ
jgi:hypothetical protein